MSAKRVLSQKHKGKKDWQPFYSVVSFIRLNGCPSGTNVCIFAYNASVEKILIM